MDIGFTGTQEGMTPPQRNWFDVLLEYHKCHQFRHGDCIGADADAHKIALKHASKIIIHPPNYDSKRAFCDKVTIERVAIQVLPEKWYIDRNHDIVDNCEMMIATPKEHSEQLRSGTWATIRYSKKVKRPLIVIFPDGKWKGYYLKEK